MRHAIPACAVLLAALSTASSALADEDERVLIDGDVRITAEMYRQEVSRLPANAQAKLRNDPDLARREVIDEMYRRIRLAQEAERRGLADAPATAYRIRVARENELVAALVEDIRNGILLPDFDQLAEESYRVRRQEFLISEALHVQHILLRYPDDPAASSRHAEAEALLESLRTGADFAELAREHSEDGSAASGGDLGWISRGQTVAPFDEAAFALARPGELSGIVETRFGLHIIRLEERREARIQAFDEVKERIVAQLRDQFIREELKEVTGVLTDPGGAKAHQEIIDQVVRE